MNYQFDVIIVGDSKAGNAAVKSIASVNKSIKIAFISRDFKVTTTRDFLSVEYIKGEVTFTDYKNRLFCCYLANGDQYYCTHLVIASGLCYAPLQIGNKVVKGVFNSINEIPKAVKNQVAIVIGNQELDVKLAIAAAKKFKYVYLCSNTIDLEISTTTKKRLETIENLLILPNTSPISIETMKDGTLISVKLDNYSEITCNAIFAITASTPEVLFVSEKLIGKNADGYLNTSNTSQSILVPKCYAIGNCASKSTKKMQASMIEAILNDFVGG